MRHLLRLLLLAALTLSATATDLRLPAAPVIPGARARLDRNGTAGAAITAGQVVYLDSNGLYQLADCDASATTSAAIGIAANGAGTGQKIIVILEDDDLTVGGTLSMTAPLYVLSGTGGGIAPIADLATSDYPVVLLVAKSTTKAVFKIVRGTALVQ